MSGIISEMMVRGDHKFQRGDLVYYLEKLRDEPTVKHYGIVAHVEEVRDEIKIWAFWERRGVKKTFDKRNNHSEWGSGFMHEEDCYLAPHRQFVKDWKNLPKFFKF